MRMIKVNHNVEQVEYQKPYNNSPKALLVNGITLGMMFCIFIVSVYSIIQEPRIHSIIVAAIALYLCNRSMNDVVIHLRRVEEIVNYSDHIKENE